jgi:hypothetical protein
MLQREYETSPLAPSPPELVEYVTDPSRDVSEALIILGGLNIAQVASPNRLTEGQIAIIDKHFSTLFGGDDEQTHESLDNAFVALPEYAVGPALTNLDRVHRHSEGEKPDGLELLTATIIGRHCAEVGEAERDFIKDRFSALRTRYVASQASHVWLRGTRRDLEEFGHVAELVDPRLPDDRAREHTAVLREATAYAEPLTGTEVLERQLYDQTVTLADAQAAVEATRVGLLWAARVHMPSTLLLDRAMDKQQGQIRIDPQAPDKFPVGQLGGRIRTVQQYLDKRYNMHGRPQETLVAAYQALGLIGIAEEYHGV